MEMRWLGRVSTIQDRVRTEGIRGASVTFVVRSQAMADHITKNGLQVLGRNYKVEHFIEVRPDTICVVCSGWGHGEHNCTFPQFPKCALCAENHRTDEHSCTVHGCQAPRGVVCIHLIAKCPNCKGPHGTHSDQCLKKKKAQCKAKGWTGKENLGPGPASTPDLQPPDTIPLETPLDQVPTMSQPDIMERDDGIYASKHAVLDYTPASHTTKGQASNLAEREAMESGLDAFRQAHPTTHPPVSTHLPPPPPPPPPEATTPNSICMTCRGSPTEFQCQECGHQKAIFKCQFNSKAIY